MHFSGPPHLRAQAIVLHSGLEHCLHVVDVAYEALATEGVGCEVMAMAKKRSMKENCAMNMLSMRAERLLNGILMSEGLCTTVRQ